MSVSLCLMVRNEEAKLAACLQSAADLVDEVIVVDTGSTDGTRELAAKHGARVFEFPWVDDFAAARNECIRAELLQKLKDALPIVAPLVEEDN
jgi:glycosyltransferase involved in cell wall biosynthesis